LKSQNKEGSGGKQIRGPRKKHINKSLEIDNVESMASEVQKSFKRCSLDSTTMESHDVNHDDDADDADGDFWGCAKRHQNPTLTWVV